MTDIKTKISENFFKALLIIFVPLTIIAELAHISPTVTFVLSSLAIIPLAKFIGEATEELSAYTGPALGGLLNASFGNVIELTISIFALQAGLTEVVKASITGAIIGNLLLVLGMAIFFGGYKRKKQTFNATAARAAGSTLLLAVVALIIPAVFAMRLIHPSSGAVENLSIGVAVIMGISYIASLYFSLHTHKHLYTQEVAEYDSKWSIKKAGTVLFLSTVIVAFMSEILVSSIEPIIASFGWTELFVGVIFVALVGNAAEHISAITMARKDRMDLALQISIGSATQIVLFVVPFLVITSYFFQTQLTLVFNTLEVVCIVFSVLLVNFKTEDGETNWLEGVQLMGAYVIMALAFYYW